MMRTTRLRRTTLHLRHIFFTEAITFMSSSFPNSFLACAPGIYLARNTIRPRVRSYGVISTVTLSPGRMRM